MGRFQEQRGAQWDSEARRLIAGLARHKWDKLGYDPPEFEGPAWTLDRHLEWCRLVNEAACEMGYA